LKKLAQKYPAIIKEIRGTGYMVGVAMNIDPLPVVAALREAGLLAVPASGIAIRLLPPLNATVAELNEAVEIFDKVLSVWKVS
jgi:acetylornithine/succinyldiaminopimelate/putrescine aminotransferase